jgi:predicted acylesterase/phospholipase RssA
MATTYSKTAIALQGGGALGAYSFGALKYIYESEPDLRLSSISGVSIGAFTAAVVAGHPDNPIDHLQSFWKDLTVFHSKLLPAQVERFFAYFGNPNFYLPRQDYFDLPRWTSFYDLSPIKDTLAKYVDLLQIARAEVKLIVTATDIESGEIKSFDNSNPDQPITIDHIIASGSLPPSYPPKRVGNRSYWDGGLFDNTPLSQLLNQIRVEDASATRVIVINLFPNRGAIPKNMVNVWDRMTEIQFSNKTKKDVALAQRINKLIAALERLQGVPAHHADSLTQLPEFADLAKYKVFDNIIAISNDMPEEVSSSADFSKASIDRRIAAGYCDAKIALTEPPKRAADIAEAITLRGSKQEKAEEHVQELLEPPGGAQLPPAGQPPLATLRKPTPSPQQMEEIADVMRKLLANEPGGRSS